MPAQRRRTQDVYSCVSSFEELLLPEPILKGLTAAGFHKPSPVQQAAIPLARSGTDLLIQAKSGTGKTVVFGVVCVESINTQDGLPQALVMAPTREIALQTADVISTLARFLPPPGLKVGVFIGGLPVEDDQKALRRICALLDGRGLHSKHMRLLVLDEADQLMTPSFQEDVLWAHSVLPSQKQVLAVSATYTPALQKQLEGLMHAPQRVMLASEAVSLLGVRQFYDPLKEHEVDTKGLLGAKMAALLRFLGSVVFHQAVVFCNSKSDAEALADQLTQASFPAAYISGEKSQVERMDTIAAVRDFCVRVIVSTDLVARGIDLERVNVVANLDLPPDAATYMHRVGRTGRFGTHGLAVTFLTSGELRKLRGFLHEVAGGEVEPLPSYIPEEDYACGTPDADEEHVVIEPLASFAAGFARAESPPPPPPTPPGPNPPTIGFPLGSTPGQASATPPKVPSLTAHAIDSAGSVRHRAGSAAGPDTSESAARCTSVPSHPLGRLSSTGESEVALPGSSVPRGTSQDSGAEEATGQPSGELTLEAAAAAMAAKYPQMDSSQKWWVGPLSADNPAGGGQSPQWLAGIMEDHSLPVNEAVSGNGSHEHQATRDVIRQDATSADKQPAEAAETAADYNAVGGRGRHEPPPLQGTGSSATGVQERHDACASDRLAGSARLSLRERLGLSDGPSKTVRIVDKPDPFAAWKERKTAGEHADDLGDNELEEAILARLTERTASDSEEEGGLLGGSRARLDGAMAEGVGEQAEAREGEPLQEAYEAMDEASRQAAWDAWYWQQSQGGPQGKDPTSSAGADSVALRQWNAWYSQYMGHTHSADVAQASVAHHYRPEQQDLPQPSHSDIAKQWHTAAPNEGGLVRVPVQLLARYYELEMQSFAARYENWLSVYQAWQESNWPD